MIKNVLCFLSKNKLNIFFIIIWFIIAFFTMLNHEVGYWDELRPISFIKEYDDFESLLFYIRHDGHPYLWYFVLYPFVKAGFTEFSMQVISLLFVFASIILLFFKSKFNILLKIFIAFSSGMIYFMGIIPRCYSLIPFFIFLIAIVYPKRINHPFLYSFLIIMLSQTHAYVWGFCLICALLFLYEATKEYIKEDKKSRLKLLILFLVFFLYSFYMIKNYVDILFFIREQFVYLSEFKSIWAVETFGNTFNIIVKNAYVFSVKNFQGFIFLICFILYFIALFKTNKKPCLIFLFSILYFFSFWFFVYTGGIYYQKLFLCFLFLIFSYWISQKNNIMLFCVNIMFLTIFLNPFFMNYIKDEVECKFTNTKEICRFLKDNNVQYDEVLFLLDGDCMYDDYKFYERIYNINKTDYTVFYYNPEVDYEALPTVKKAEETIKNNTKIKYVITTSWIIGHFKNYLELESGFNYKQCEVINKIYPGGISYVFKVKR